MVQLLTFVLAMFITMALIPPLMRGAQNLRLVDIPDDRKTHVGAIPRIGGIAMAVGALVPMIVWLPLDRELVGVLLGLGVILFFGAWDDRVDLDYRIKFLGQGVAITTIILYGGVHISYLPFFGLDELPLWASVMLTMFVLLAVTNAINLSDGLDGLAAGITLLGLGLIVFLAYVVQMAAVSLIGLAVMGSILGFLRFNAHPARIFMGDGGSQFLGLTVGVLVLMLTQGQRADFSPLLPLLLLGLPLLDTSMVMVIRFFEGRSPFSPDRNHIHHRLLALGLNHYEVVLVIYLLQALLTILAFFLRYADDVSVLLVYGVFCALLLTALSLAKEVHWHVPHFSKRQKVWTRYLERDGLLARIAYMYVLVVLPFFMAAAALLSSGISLDITLLSLFLVFLLFFERWRNRQSGISWLERGVIYTGTAVLFYLADLGSESSSLHPFFFASLLIAVMLGFRYSKDRGFTANPSDFLIVFLMVALLTLPQLQPLGPFWTSYIPKLVVLYYGIEMILPRRPEYVRLLAGMTLGIILIRGVL